MYLLLFTLIFMVAGYAVLPLEKQKNIISLIDAFTRLVQALKPPHNSSDDS